MADKMDMMGYNVVDNDGRVNRSDRVDRPDHYTAKSIEPIDVIEAWSLNFSLGNAVKYIGRHGLKSEKGLLHAEKTLEDLKKASWYLKREIERLQNVSN